MGTAHQLAPKSVGSAHPTLRDRILDNTEDGAFSVWYYPPQAAYATDSECDNPVATAASPLEQVQKSETMREFVGAKLHGLRVTGKSLEYEGSASLATSLMEAAGISPYERVYLVNKSTGSR